MVYFISTVSLLLLVTVDAYELDEINYLPRNYWSIMKYATTPAAYSTVPYIKRQGIIPGPRVGRSFASPYDHYHQFIASSASTNNNDNNNLNSDNVKSKNVNKYNSKYDSIDNFHPELHDFQSMTGFNSRGKRSLRMSEIASSASSPSASNPSPTSSIGSAVDMASIEDNSSPQSMAIYTRSTRQLIPAPRVGRSSPTSLSSSYLSPNLLTGFSQQASTYNRASDDEVNSYEGDQQLGYTNLGTHGGIQLLAVPRNYLNPFIAKDLFKRVALTPRIGRSDGSSIGSKGWLDDDDYYNRIIKSSFTPRVGRSVDAVNGDKSMKSSKP